MKIRDVAEKHLDLDGYTLDKAIEYLSSLLTIYEDKGWSDLYIDYDYYNYDGGYDIQLKGYRDETSKEEKKRLDREEHFKLIAAKNKTKKEEKERKEYERLKKKFG